MVAYTDALARWREYHDVVTHVARCQCDDCVEAREDAEAEALAA